MICLRFVLILGLFSSIGAFAQGPGGPPPPPPFGDRVTFQDDDFIYMRAEFGTEGKVVKGSPYSAQVVTEFTQSLADGNRIHRTNSGSVARDSEGRTRREQTMGAIGPLAASGDVTKSILVQDPVSGMGYMLDPNRHTARSMHTPKVIELDSSADPAIHEYVARIKESRPKRDPSEVKSENLGTQVMEGVAVQGKRVTHTIPAGQIGNERPLEIITETWYSRDLQTVVMSKTTDPRSGESVYKLTGISRTEPDHSLFEVPADYTVTEAQGVRMERRPPRMAPKRD